MLNPNPGASVCIAVCQNQAGFDIQACVLKWDAASALFEVYNPYSIVRLSEKLRNFQLYLEGEVIFSGEAVVSHLSNTGLILVCQVVLGKNRLSRQEEKLPLPASPPSDLIACLQPWFEELNRLRSSADVWESQKFMDRWARLSVSLGQWVRSDMMAFRFWLRHQSFWQEQDVLLDAEQVNALFGLHWSYAQRENFYAEWDRSGEEHCRFWVLPKRLRDADKAKEVFWQSVLQSMRAQQSQGLCQLHWGCPSRREMEIFLPPPEEPVADQWTVLDSSVSALEAFAEESRALPSSRLQLRLQEYGVNQFLQDVVSRRKCFEGASFHVIYLPNVMEYLSERVCQRLLVALFEYLHPGGVLLFSHVAIENPFRSWIELTQDWFREHRSADQLKNLVNSSLDAECIHVNSDPWNINYHVLLKKSSSAVEGLSTPLNH